LRILKELSYQLTGAQLGITITAVLIGFIAKPTVASVLESPVRSIVGESAKESVSLVVAIVLATFAAMILGELVPKNIAIAKTDITAKALAKPFRMYSFAAKPIIALSDAASNWLTRRLGVEPAQELERVPNLEDLSSLIRTSGEEGTLGFNEVDLLTKSLRFARKTANEVMVPRLAIHSLPQGSTITDLVELSATTGLSRFPVVDNDLDSVVGIAHVKSALLIDPKLRSDQLVETVMGDILAIPETRDLLSVMTDMRRQRIPLAVVVDEHGGTEGIVSIEDLLEEIVGEIEDEYDAAVENGLEERAGVFTVSGNLHPHEVADMCGFEIEDGQYETIAGFALEKLQRIPAPGEMFRYERWKIEILEMDNLRIARLRLTEPVSNLLYGRKQSGLRG
jgi:CBS domain containing-hemolysin-like protein|tara:strand:+ start:4412 stop:5596 length:1185 start_codon:yes stop_codon:yes gene_type:complete